VTTADTTTELLRAAQAVPWLGAALVAVGTVSWVVEKVAGLTGPITTLHRAWADRELRRLRRSALLRAERRRLAAEEESAVMADLRSQIADLSAEVARLRGTVREAEASQRRVKDWADGLLRAARAAGLHYADPPRTDERPAIPESRNPAPAELAPR
jgi:TolA-binding protein